MRGAGPLRPPCCSFFALVSVLAYGPFYAHYRAQYVGLGWSLRRQQSAVGLCGHLGATRVSSIYWPSPWLARGECPWGRLARLIGERLGLASLLAST